MNNRVLYQNALNRIIKVNTSKRNKQKRHLKDKTYTQKNIHINSIS